MASKLLITLNDDGSVKLNARGMDGTEAEIKAELEELAKELGGPLVVEKHEPGLHHHHGTHTHEKLRGRS